MKYSQRVLILGIAMLFLGTSAVPLTESAFSAEPPVSIELDGMLGENGWYVSPVTITFVVNSEEVDYIMFELDGGEWTVYTEPLVVGEDGEHTICWYYVDNEGNHSEIECMDFKIDQIVPTINLTIQKIGFWKYMAKADVSDETSGVNRVEFYIDFILIGTVTEEPYECECPVVMGMGHIEEAVVYDNAGNYKISETSPRITSTRVFGIISNPKFTEDTVSFFAIVVLCRGANSFCPFPFFFRQLTFQTAYSTYSGYIGNHFIFAVFEYGPWLS
jgi:hypothetical protein